MSIYLPSTGGYPPYWGPQTSHMNFCEEDYHVTPYIGEFINTLTSLFYAYLGFRGMAAVSARGELGFLPVVPYVAIIVLGAASALFHGTLKYPMQLSVHPLTKPLPNGELRLHAVDDNTMLFGAAIMLHRLFAHNLSTTSSLLIFATLNALVCGVIYAHIALGESTLHHVVFAGMMLTSAIRTSRLIHTTVKDKTLKRQMRVVGSWALGLMITGYALWNVDNTFCEGLRSLRGRIGLPWAWLLELHGWWHILTGLAVYLHTLVAECLCPWGQTEPIPLGDRIPRWPKAIITTRADIKRHPGEKKID